MSAAPPSPLPTSFLDPVAPVPFAAPEPPVTTPSPMPFPSFDSTPPGHPPPPVAVMPENPPTRLTPPPLPPRPAPNGMRTISIAPIAGLLVVLVLVALVVHQRRKVHTDAAARNLAAMQVDVATVPTGASVKLTAVQSAAGGNQETTCTSNCRLTLIPGTYQVYASLDGYDPVDGAVTVSAGRPAVVSLTLPPQAQSVRLLTDLDKGKVVVDGGSPLDLKEGQLVLDKLAPGTHIVKGIGQNADGSFSFEIAEARLPIVAGPVKARNMIAVLVASFGRQARLTTSTAIMFRDFTGPATI